MKFPKPSEGSVKIFYALIITCCFLSNTTLAFQTEELYQEMEGYYVGMKDDTSFVTFKIPMYLEGPNYVVLQTNVKYFDQAGDLKKLNSKNTKSYGFAFHNKLIRMVSFKVEGELHHEFLRLLDEDEYQLPNGEFKLFVKYKLPQPLIISTFTQESLSKQYLYQQGNSKLTPINSLSGLNKLSDRLIENPEN